MKEKRLLVALGALSAALAACGSEVGPGNFDPDMMTGGTGGSSAAPGTGGSSSPGKGGTSNASTGGSAGSTSPGTGGTSATTGGTGGTDAGGGGTGAVTTCTPGIPASSQIPRLKNAEYDAVIKDLVGLTALTSSGNMPPSSLLADDFEGDMTDIAWNGYLNAAERIAAEVMAGPNKANFIACEPSMAGCLETTIETFGRKAFRRPLSAEEKASFLRLNNLTPKGTPAEVAEAILFAFLASPSFIMLPELDEAQAEGGAIKLSQHEVATRLSFMLWGTTPDQTLSDAADSGALATKEQILAQAQRMVQDRARTGPAIAAFHRTYADIRVGTHWNSISHDPEKFPQFTDSAKAPMMAEVDRFFEDVAFEGGSFADLFLSNIGYVNQDTAELYGLPKSAYGAELQRVELNPEQRPGFLTRVGFLSSFSSYGASSPVLRGAYITKSILGVHIDDPPPDAAETPVPDGVYTTQRQVIEALTGAPKCAGCHAELINPAGFVLERYNSVGQYQDVDALGGPINSTADVLFNQDTIKTITSPLELMTELGLGADAKRRYAEKWVSFATGRQPNPNDACVVNDLSGKLSADGYTIINLLTDLTQVDSFRLRTIGQ
jgi:hypothetical protein